MSFAKEVSKEIVELMRNMVITEIPTPHEWHEEWLTIARDFEEYKELLEGFLTQMNTDCNI